MVAVLIAQLHRAKVLTPHDFDTMKRRLIEGDDEEVATAIDSVILSDMFDDPDQRRATIHIVDGGNDAG